MLLLISEKPLSQSQLSEHYPGYHAEIPLLEYHVKAAGIRSMAQFYDKLEESTKPVKLFALIDKQAYKAAVKALNEAGDWLINDARVLWFYKAFVKEMSGGCQVVVIKSSDNVRFNEFAMSVVGDGKDVTIVEAEGEADVTAEEILDGMMAEAE